MRSRPENLALQGRDELSGRLSIIPSSLLKIDGSATPTINLRQTPAFRPEKLVPVTPPVKIKPSVRGCVILKRPGILFLSLLLLLVFHSAVDASDKTMTIKLSHPRRLKEKGISQLLNLRYSCRDFSRRSLSPDDLSALLWAASGKAGDSVTSASRTVPSAGATHPLEIYLVTGKDTVKGIEQGLYHYSIEGHSLEPVFCGRDIRRELGAACLGQGFIEQAAVSLIITAKFERTTARYGQRGISYVYIEAGHSCQNIYLMAADLGLGTVEVGAFDNRGLRELLSLDTEPIIVMPVGYAR